MAFPRHLVDPAAHAALFAAVRAEMEQGILAAMGAAFVPGMILSFSGTLGGTDGKRPINPHTGEAVEGFAVCDGGTYKAHSKSPLLSTPDLRERFIIGTGPNYAAGKTGGAKTHEHAVKVGDTTLTVEQMPSHSHTVKLYTTSSTSGINPGGGATNSSNTGYTTTASTVSGSGQSHTHSATASGGDLPPWYALAYIMKL